MISSVSCCTRTSTPSSVTSLLQPPQPQFVLPVCCACVHRVHLRNHSCRQLRPPVRTERGGRGVGGSPPWPLWSWQEWQLRRERGAAAPASSSIAVPRREVCISSLLIVRLTRTLSFSISTMSIPQGLHALHRRVHWGRTRPSGSKPGPPPQRGRRGSSASNNGSSVVLQLCIGEGERISATESSGVLPVNAPAVLLYVA